PLPGNRSRATSARRRSTSWTRCLGPRWGRCNGCSSARTPRSWPRQAHPKAPLDGQPFSACAHASALYATILIHEHRGTNQMASGIRDKVAIIGMGCSRFGERWDCGTEHLLNEAFAEALQDSGIERKQIGAAWFGSAADKLNVGNSAIPLSTALRLEGIPVSRVENMCATGTEALRGAAYAVAAGAVDFALAIGAE